MKGLHQAAPPRRYHQKPITSKPFVRLVPESVTPASMSSPQSNPASKRGISEFSAVT